MAWILLIANCYFWTFTYFISLEDNNISHGRYCVSHCYYSRLSFACRIFDTVLLLHVHMQVFKSSDFSFNYCYWRNCNNDHLTFTCLFRAKNEKKNEVVEGSKLPAVPEPVLKRYKSRITHKRKALAKQLKVFIISKIENSILDFNYFFLIAESEVISILYNRPGKSVL